MKTNILSLVSLGAVALSSAGCAEYFNVEEACQPKGTYPGQAYMGAIEDSAFNRMNCYRRLSGLLKANINPQVQDAAVGQIAYIQANPDFNRITGSRGSTAYLAQLFDEPEFTGANAIERLDRAGYVLADPLGTSFTEYLAFTWAADPADLPTGADAMDNLFRNHEWRQWALQPSWIDGGYTEAELNRDWMINAEYCKFIGDGCDEEGNPPPNLSGRVFYMLVIHNAPHIEKADQPFVFPKREQVQVPLYSWSENIAAIDVIGEPVPVQISYPITIFGGVIDPAQAKLGDQNIYGLEIIASIVEVGAGPVETEIVLPGSAPDRVFPDGYDLRQVASVFAREPFKPGTQYQLYADVTTFEATFAVDIDFTTAVEDPGLVAQTTNYTTASRAYQPAEIQAHVRDNPEMVAPSQRHLITP